MRILFDPKEWSASGKFAISLVPNQALKIGCHTLIRFERTGSLLAKLELFLTIYGKRKCRHAQEVVANLNGALQIF